MRVVSADDVRALLPMRDAIEVVDRVMRVVSAGGAELPLRSVSPVGGANRLGVMPGALSDPPCFGAKLVSLFPGNPAAGRSGHEGALVIFEPDFGEAVGCLPCDAVTALRTAAASAVATRALARPEAAVLALVGHGEQAWSHLSALREVCDIAEVRVAGRDAARAGAFAERARAAHPDLAVTAGADVRAAVHGADIVCTVTSAAEPVLYADEVAPGAHVNAVGASVPSVREIDKGLLLRAEVFCDFRPSFFAQAGEARELIEIGAADESLVRAEIGEVLSGARPGRGGARAITLYRSLGIAAQDLACGWEILRRARERGLGVEAPLARAP